MAPGTEEKDNRLDALVETWRIDPTQPELLDALEPLVRAQAQWPEMIELTTRLIASARDPSHALAYAEALIGWCLREAPNPQLAQYYLDYVRKVDGTHWLVHLFQAAKYEEHGDTKRELEALDRAVLSAKRPADRARIHMLMAQRYASERTANPAEARKHLKKAHDLAPKSMEVLRALEQHHIAEGDVAALATVLEEQLDTVEDVRERAAIAMRLADLYEKEFVRPERALESLELAFALDPTRDDAIAGLERCYIATRRWGDLARVLEAAIVLIEDEHVRAERLLVLAETYESRLGDLASAGRAFEQLGAILGDDETLIGELARLAEKRGDYQAAARHRVKLAELAPDPTTKARMHVAAGSLLAPHDATAARAHFEVAIDFDPANAAAHAALMADARAKGDLARVADYLETRVAAVDGRNLQAQIWAELGEVRRELGDPNAALAAFEVAIALDPTHAGAARALLDAYVIAERWADAAPLCDLVVHAAERAGDDEQLYVAQCQAFEVAWNTGEKERALGLILGAFELHPEADYVRQALVTCAWSLREDSTVLQAADALARLAPDGLPRDSLVRLGQTLALIGDPTRAMAVFDSVVARDPTDAEALSGLSSLRAARGETLAAWMIKRQLAEGTTDENARFALLVEAGDGLAREVKRPDLAADVYEQARALRPHDHVLLHKLLTQLQALERWPQVFDVLRAIVDADEDDARRAKVVMTMAALAQSKLGDPMKAVSLLDDALELDPKRLDAFERLVRILTEAKDARALAFMYKRMVRRARGLGDARLEHALLLQLGLIYRDRLRERDNALETFRAAAQLVPDDQQAMTMLRELLTTSGRPDDAIAVTRARVHENPLEPAPYAPLFDLLSQLGRVDSAWCVASVMAHVGATHAPATALLRSRPPPALEQITGTLGEDGWRGLLHPELDPTLTSIFEIMAQAAAQAHIAALGLRERLAHPGAALKPPAMIVYDVARVSHVLGVVTPRLFIARRPPAITVAITKPPSLLIHPESLPAFPRNLLAFWIGKRVVELTPPLLARGLFRSISELKDLVAAAARIVDGGSGKALDRADAALRSQIPRPSLDELADAVARVKSAGAPLDVRRWSQLADLSASRAGLVIVGDVETARLALVQEAQSPGELSVKDQMRDLALFFCSDEYARMRAALHVTLTR